MLDKNAHDPGERARQQRAKVDSPRRAHARLQLWGSREADVFLRRGFLRTRIVGAIITNLGVGVTATSCAAAACDLKCCCEDNGVSWFFSAARARKGRRRCENRLASSRLSRNWRLAEEADLSGSSLSPRGGGRRRRRRRRLGVGGVEGDSLEEGEKRGRGEEGEEMKKTTNDDNCNKNNGSDNHRKIVLIVAAMVVMVILIVISK